MAKDAADLRRFEVRILEVAAKGLCTFDGQLCGRQIVAGDDGPQIVFVRSG